ncbi:MAG: hypothetical protein IJS81_02915 [Selenomonadaceae bacterium]|nr:hypothetical protein [Selenomonadaceae bacterium]
MKDEYTKIKYYDSGAKKLSAKYFNVDKHTDALKAIAENFFKIAAKFVIAKKINPTL